MLDIDWLQQAMEAKNTIGYMWFSLHPLDTKDMKLAPSYLLMVDNISIDKVLQLYIDLKSTKVAMVDQVVINVVM